MLLNVISSKKYCHRSIGIGISIGNTFQKQFGIGISNTFCLQSIVNGIDNIFYKYR